MNKIRLPILLLSVITLSVLDILLGSRLAATKNQEPFITTNQNPSILGNSTTTPTIFISSSGQNYHTGGVLSQSVLDEPAIQLYAFDGQGQATVDIYQADINHVLTYLRHDSENKQISTPDISGLAKINSLTTNITQAENRVLLPISGEGIWLTHIKFGQSQNFAFFIRSSVAALVKEGNNELLIWTQDLISKKTVAAGDIQIYSLLDSVDSITKSKIGSDGIIRIPIGPQTYDVAVVNSGGRIALIPINLRYLNGGGRYEIFQQKAKTSRLFVFTDRPLYRPEDTVYFKAVIREDDDVRYKIPKGTAVIKAYKSWDKNAAFFEQTLPISDQGTVDGKFIIPASQGTGDFNINLEIPNTDSDFSGWDYETWNQSTASFQVEHFRKPDYSLDISAPKTIALAGDDLTANISGTFFSGQPLSNRTVHYTVSSHTFYEYEFLNENPQFFDAGDYYYGYWDGQTLFESDITLDATGNAIIDIQTGAEQYKSDTPRVLTLQAKYSDETGNLVNAKKNFLVYPGEFSIFRHSNFYTGQINQPFNFPVLVKSHNSSSIKDIKLTAKVTRETWVAQPAPPDKKYPNYVKETQRLPDLTVTTDQLGKAQFTFTPVHTGSYRFEISGRDRRGNTISKTMYTWVSDTNRPAPSGQYYQELKIETDKQNYEPNETVNLKIWSDIPNRDFFLTFERGRVNRRQIISMNGQTATVPLRLEATDVPNIYITLSGFNDNYQISDSVNVSVSPDSKRLKVNISPESSRYGPGQTAIVNLETKDSNGKPVSADVAFWAVDKAIFELSDSNLGDIFKRFWSQRYNQTASSHSLENIITNNAEMGGCFLSGTQILMSDGSTKPIETIKPGEHVLTKPEPGSSPLVRARVIDTHQTTEDGYMIINSTLKLTPSHIVYANGAWTPAGDIQPGDFLSDRFGKPVHVDSVEWQSGSHPVFNLQIEKFHTFIADGFWVHNDKDSGNNRSVFKDTAYWNPGVRTDTNGRARVTFRLPDNLTSWTLAAVASTADTRVGQATTEIITSKEVFIRPILPNFLRSGDKTVLSALLYNYTDSPQTFDTIASFDSGKILSGQNQNSVLINPNGFHQLYWEVSADKVNPSSSFEISAKSKLGKTDIVTAKIPIIPFGFNDSETKVGSGEKIYSLNIPADTDLQNSTISISLASNLLGTIPTAMKYLIDYPYGCVEQTTSRLVPAIIAKNNLDIYYDAIESKDLEKIITKGVERLTSLKSADGGWGWWSENHSQIYITDYVLEYLLQAKNSGSDIPDSLINPALEMLRNQNPSDPTEQIYKLYGLSLTGNSDSTKITNFSNLGPVAMSFAVQINSKTDQDPETNGLNSLIAQGVQSGENIYWPADPKSPYPSVDASTALAIKAIVSANGNREIAAKGIRYLLSSRQANYWANTHGTALVISAVTAFYKSGSEANPNFTYSVSLNDKSLSSGSINSSTQIIKPVVISGAPLQTGENKIIISKSGSGEIYSTLTGNYWRTDKNASPVSKTISLAKTITNNKGPEYSVGVGDTVTITLSVSDLPPDSKYLVVEDQLPAGLIPVNTHLKNETDSNDYRFYSNNEYTQTGVIISSYFNGGSFSYQARAINEGSFLTPPATTQLMYQPEIFARTAPEMFKIDKNSQMSLIKQIEKQISDSKISTTNPFIILGGIIGIILLIASVILLLRVVKKKPPAPPVSTPTPPIPTV